MQSGVSVASAEFIVQSGVCVQCQLESRCLLAGNVGRQQSVTAEERKSQPIYLELLETNSH